MIYLAFYKHKKRVTSPLTLMYRLLDDAIRFATRGEYSHCELAIDRGDGQFWCYSASARDGGVRKKVMALPAERWDLINLDINAAQIERFYEQTEGAKYDYLGAIGLVLPFTQNRGRYFCSEWCFNAIFNSNEGWRFSPNQLAAL